jgi:hypothetical protein
MISFMARLYPVVWSSAGVGAMMSMVGKYVRYRPTSRVSGVLQQRVQRRWHGELQAGYAIDTVIPLINIGQGGYWRPDASVPYGWIVELASWAGICLGWALATLIVAGYTGLARRVDNP